MQALFLLCTTNDLRLKTPMKLYLVTFLLTSLFLGCNSNAEKGDSAYFVGEIINTNNNYISINDLDVEF